MWRATEWACNEKENAVIDSLKKVYKWRSTVWWRDTKALNETEAQVEGHNRGCVWDKIASE